MPNDQTPPVGTEQEPVTPQTPPPAAPEPPADPKIPPAPAPADPDYKDKFRQSASEAQVLNARNQQLEQQLRTLTTQEAPTETELKTRYPEWDSYDSFTKSTLTNQIALEKRLAKQEATQIEILAGQKWEADLKALVKQPKYEQLKNDSGFEDFVFQPKHRGVDLTVLADAYLFKTGKVDTPPTTPAPATPPIRDEGLPRGSGARPAADQPGFSTEEIEIIRTKDPKRFRELLTTGQIKLG